MIQRNHTSEYMYHTKYMIFLCTITSRSFEFCVCCEFLVSHIFRVFRFHVLNVHTMDELKLTGNSMLGSRPLLNFDAKFNQTPHWQ